jgi:RHS repeat-associated protein
VIDGLLSVDPAGDPAVTVPVEGPMAGGASPPVTVSGWQVFDDKGRVVEQYEPFFDTGWAIQWEKEAKQGVHLTMYYDPRGQVIRTVNPDGSEQRVIYGIPQALDVPTDPDGVAPTPWEIYTYDGNDNAGRTHPGDPAVAAYRHHWNTPATVRLDPLGRTVEVVARSRAPAGSLAAPLPPIEEHVTRSRYDVQGNLLAVTDALGRVAFLHTYDLAGRALRTDGLDAGMKRSVLDAAGSPLETRDAKGALALHGYDALNRPVRRWARDRAGEAVTLREMLVYGDDPGLAGSAPAQHNLLGRLHEHRDEAGVVTVADYDFAGNAIDSRRQVLSDDFMLANVRAQTGPAWTLEVPRVDWAAPAANLLDGVVYRTRKAFDALGRVQWASYPEFSGADRYRLRARYNSANALERVELEGPLGADGTGPRVTYVERLAYDAKRQRTLVAYGNGLITRYAYDPQTLRLRRLRTERFTPEPLGYRLVGAPLQDISYAYDLAGNLLRTQERTPGCGVTGNLTAAAEADPTLRQLLTAGNALVRRFEYDPLYRLTAATGRECADIPSPRAWEDDLRCGYDSGNHGTADQENAPDLTAVYREEYAYDAAGNVVSLRHRQLVPRAGGAAWETTWSRDHGIGGLRPDDWRQAATGHLTGDWPDPPSNRLTHVWDRAAGMPAPPTAPLTHESDASGNVVRENGSRYFEWDHGDRMKAFRVQAGTAEPSIYALYVYDASGQRIKKLVRTQGGDTETTVYAAPAFERHRRVTAAATVENSVLHVLDDARRVALVRVGLPLPGDGAAAHPVQFHLEDHLGSGAVVVSLDGTWINREEFLPYGETSFGSYGRKRYRYTGKERDEESGLAYHGARYYAPHVLRWLSADPAGPVDGPNQFAYVKNNPVRHVDPTGTQTPDDTPDADADGPPPMPLDGPLVIKPELDKTRVCVHPLDNPLDAARKDRLWSLLGAAAGRDGNLTVKARNVDEFYALHENLMGDAVNEVSDRLCGYRPFKTRVAGTSSGKEVWVSSDIKDPDLRDAATAHEEFHSLTKERLKTLDRVEAGKILDPKRYSLQNLKTDPIAPKDLELDIRRCEEFLAYEITYQWLLKQLKPDEVADANALIGSYLYKGAQPSSSPSARAGIGPTPQQCQDLLPGTFTYDPATKKGTLTLPTVELPRGTSTVTIP